MSNPSAVYWIGSNGNTYVKAAGVDGVQDYGRLPAGSSIAYATQINDPNPGGQQPASTTTTTSGGGGAGNGDLSSYDQSINATNAEINDLAPSLNNLLQGAYNKYTTTVNGLNQSRATADKTYGENKISDAQDYSGAKNTIRTNTGNTISGIDTMLGARGGGGQEAGNYAALLAGKAGSGQLRDAGTNFGKNEQGLDTNYNDFLTGYNTNVTNAGLQRDSDVNGANADIQTKKANLLQSLASLINQRTAAAGGSGTAASQPYVNEANSLLSNASAISAPRIIPSQTPITYTAPALSSYTTNPTTVTSGGNAATDTVTPFTATLLNRNKQLQAA